MPIQAIVFILDHYKERNLNEALQRVYINRIAHGIVIVSILATLELPSYYSYVMKSHRAEGIDTLNSIQLQQEKYRSYNSTYGDLTNVWEELQLLGYYYNLAIIIQSALRNTATATLRKRIMLKAARHAMY